MNNCINPLYNLLKFIYLNTLSILYMIATIRHLISRLFPENIRFYLALKTFPFVVNSTAKVFQGINNYWENDQHFTNIYKQVKSIMLLDKKRSFIIYQMCKNCNNIKGDFAELGIYKGGSAMIMFQSSNKNIYCFDTFEGTPKINKKKDSFWKKGHLKNVSYKNVKDFLTDKRFKIFKGQFPKSLPKTNNVFSLVHIDVNIYQSTLDGCKYFYNKMSKSGIMLFDDYNITSSDGVKKAVDQFFKDKKEKPIMLFTGQAFIVKQ